MIKMIIVLLLSVAFAATAVAQTTAPVPSFSSIGCLSDESGHLLATGYPSASVSNYFKLPMTTEPLSAAEYCVTLCHGRGTLFAAVTNASVCTCGVFYRSSDVVSSSFCDATCTPATNPCGGGMYASVFQINLEACPSDASYYRHRDSCYRYVNSATNWSAAEALCEAEGGHLATIDSTTTNNFVLSLPNGMSLPNSNSPIDFWAGGIYYGPTTGFEWITGYLLTFTNWMDSEPATDIRNENCLDLAATTPSPIGGTWSSKGCDVAKSFICKKFVNASGPAPVLPPRVQIVGVGSSTACVPPTNVNLDHTRFLEAHFTLDQSTIDSIANTATDSSEHQRTATFNSYDGFANGYTFERNELTWGSSLHFDGNLTLVLPTGWDVPSDDTITVSAWVRTTKQDSPRRFEVIVSKDASEAPQLGDNFAWSLVFLNNEQFCFYVGPKSVCTPQSQAPTHYDNWRFVVGVYDGISLDIFIDGVQAGTTAGFNTPLLHNVSLPVVIGGQAFPVNWSSRVTFQGMLDDVRIYSAALPVGDLQYLQECELNPFLTNVVEAYINTPLTLTLMGHDLDYYQRLGLSTTGCNNGTAFTAGLAPIYMLGYTPVRRILTFPAAQLSAPGDYSLCYTTPNDPTVYEGGLNITIRVVQISALNGSQTHAFINTDTSSGNFVSAAISIEGVNIHDGTVVLLSPFRTCNYGFGNSISFLNGSSPDGSSAVLNVMHAAIQNDFYYLCWAGSFDDAANVNRVVPTGLVIELTGSRYGTKIVADNDGTTVVNAQTIIDGFALTNGNYFMDCNSLNDTADNYYLQVAMGSFVDYIIPAPGHTACDVLLGKSAMAPWGGNTLYLASYYSPVNPLAREYDGSLTKLIPSGNFGSLGGSASGFPSDGRQQLSQWGETSDGDVGGCCFSVVHQERAWFQPYTIVAYAFNLTSVYFQVYERPSIVFPGEEFSVRLRMVDIHGYRRANVSGCNFELDQDGSVTNVFSQTCDYTFRLSLSQSTSSNFRAKASLADPNSPYMIVNANVAQFAVSTTPLPFDSQLLSSTQNVTKLLSFRSSDGLFAAIDATGLDIANSLFSPSDSMVQPMEEQPMTATNYMYKPPVSYSWYWLSISDASGLFGQQVSQTNGLQYFAFALYSATNQNLGINGGCATYIGGAAHKDCDMYIDGVSVYKSDEIHISSISGGSNEYGLAITSGWHQVVVKLFNSQPTGPAEGFWVNFDGSGLATNVDKPLDAPDGSTPMVVGRPIQELLWLKANPTVAASFDVNGLPNGEDEAQAFPTEDLDWTSITVPSSGLPLNSFGGAFQMSLYYFATGIYSTSFGSATFTIPNAVGAVRIYQDGQRIANYPADLNGPTRTVTLRFMAGWSQLLFKVSAAAGSQWSFQFSLAELSQLILFSEPIIPETLPSDATDFNDLPLGSALALLSQGSGVYALAYNSLSTTDPAAVDPTYTQVNTSRFNSNGDTEPVNQVPFIWSTVSAVDSTTGRIGEMRNDGGGYNRYYSFAMYVSRFSPTLNASMGHIEGVGLWLDGKFIAGQTTSANSGTDQGLTVNFINVSRGWHTVHVRVQARNSLKFVSVGTASHDLAKQTCWNNALNLCERDFDVCPLNVARSDIGLPYASSSWAALGLDNEWIQLSKSDSSEALCGTEIGDTIVSQSSGTFNAACCGLYKTPYFTFSVYGIPSRTRVGWAAVVPPQLPWSPFIMSSPGSDGQSVLVTIFSNQSGAQVLYTLSRGAYPSTSYTSPISVRYAGLVRAITRINGADSPIAELFVFAAGNYTIGCDLCSKGVDCLAQLSRMNEITSALSGSVVAVIVDTSPASNSQILENVIASSAYVQNADTSALGITSFLSVDSNNIVRIPSAFLSRPSITQLTMVVFSASATTRDIAGTAVPGTIAIAPLAPTVSTIYRNLQYAPLSLTGGFIGGDLLSFPELFMDQASWAARNPNDDLCSLAACNAMENDRFFGLHMANFVGGETFLVNTSFVNSSLATAITCACISGIGGLTIPNSAYSAYSSPSVVRLTTPVTIIDPPAPSTSRYTEVISFGPRVVSAFHDESDGSQPLRPAGRGLDNRIWVYGNFPSPNSADYSATLQCAAGVAQTTYPFNCSSVVPTLSIVDVSAGAMTLHVHAPNNGLGVSGLWTLRIMYGQTNANVPVNYETSFFVAVLSPTPNITQADGDCARSSTNCRSSHLVTFIGSNFNPVDAQRNKIDLIDTTTLSLSRTVFCHVEAATESSVTCRLLFLSPAAAGARVNVVARVEAIPASDVYQSGEVFASSVFDTHSTLNFESQGAGWSGNLAPEISPTTTETPSGNNGSPSDGSSGVSAGIIAAIVCGVLLVGGIIVAAFVVTKFDLVPKKKSSQMSEVEQSLNEAV